MNRFEWGSGEISVLNQKNMDCHNCIYKTDMVGICPKFPDVKPKNVLNGGKCEEKVKED